jgi:hypothetical protein
MDHYTGYALMLDENTGGTHPTHRRRSTVLL